MERQEREGEGERICMKPLGMYVAAERLRHEEEQALMGDVERERERERENMQQEEEETETLALEMILTAMGCPLRSPLRILAKQV